MKFLKAMLYLLSVILLLFLGLLGLLYYNQDKLIFFPELLPEEYTYSFPYQFEEIQLDQEDGEKIYGLFFPAKGPSKGTVLYFHGNAGSLRSWGGVAEDFVPRGWDLLMTDYRGYGKSRARLTEKGMYEDAEKWYSYLQTHKAKKENEILIYGRSIGTGVALDLGTKTYPAYILLETPYTSIADLAREFYPFVPSWFLSFALDSKKKIEKVKSPITIFHGDQDEIVPFEQGQALFQIATQAGKDAKFVRIEGGNHNNLSFYPKYQKGLSEILDSVHANRGRTNAQR
ncbi:alpha/beta hydrolase [Leptospira semungkisensis]|uniref:Alpha/beta hydrolase n=1 Tax=Leptospira semungkisensis TaxID=2484985 RepID=A0A4R9G7R1_9LEPT|nr:alpha/beta hydrolase [Leptospira semungkisensis]TGK07070.1 alpha/beta hydrolase [Leptospira semungkisensis]